jgi:5'-nucleotidase
MRLLLTNDDGVTSPGLFALVQALRERAELDIVAPDRNWSAAGHQRTVDRPLRVHPTVLADGTPAFATDGSPSDCVGLALGGLLDVMPSLVIAGINRGRNIGHDVAYSGTVAAATEAAMCGVPAIAISLADWLSTDFDVAAEFAARLVRLVERNGLSTETVLNVNVPAHPRDQIGGVSVTVLSGRTYASRVERRDDPLGRPYYWLAGSAAAGFIEAGTDLEALEARRISITPLKIDRTHDAMRDELGSWPFDLGKAGGTRG